jgi:hypothetical protein
LGFNPVWKTDGFSPGVQWISNGFLNQALMIEGCASASPTNHCSTSTSSFGSEAAVSDHTNTHTAYVCPDTSIGDCTTAANGHGAQEETWYRFHVRFETGYQPTVGTQNAIWEFHVDSLTESDAAAHGGVTAYSTTIEVKGEGTSCTGSPPFCDHPGVNPQLYLQVPAGPTSCGNACLTRYFPFGSNSLLIDHWYDMVLHMIWSGSSSAGLVQWYVDGVKAVDVQKATLYTRSDGSWSYGNGFGAYNYRLWANFDSKIDFDEIVWGPTAASIGFGSGVVNPPSGLTATVQ